MMESKRSILVEVLVMLLIIGVAGGLSALAVNTARSKQRDAVRLSQVSRVQSALENYFNDANRYPTGDHLPLGDSAVAGCLGSEGFSSACSSDKNRFLRPVSPTPPAGLEGLVRCGAPIRSAICYSANAEGTGYGIEFELENTLQEAGLIEGINCATPDTIKAGRC